MTGQKHTAGLLGNIFIAWLEGNTELWLRFASLIMPCPGHGCGLSWAIWKLNLDYFSVLWTILILSGVFFFDLHGLKKTFSFIKISCCKSSNNSNNKKTQHLLRASCGAILSNRNKAEMRRGFSPHFGFQEQSRHVKEKVEMSRMKSNKIRGEKSKFKCWE